MRPTDYFLRGVRRAPARPFLIGDDCEVTFAAAAERIEAIARGLYARGFAPGDSVGVYSPNDVGAVLCILAATLAGGAWVPVNVRNSATGNAQYMAYTRTRWLFYHSSVAAEAAEVMRALPELRGAVCLDRADDARPSLDAFCAAGAGADLPDPSDPFGAPEAVFSRWPTGGTTGPSKGVEMSNRNIVTMFELGLKHYVGAREDDIVHLAVAPITHAAGVIIGIFASVGGTTVIHSGFEPAAVLAAIERHRVTHLFLPPTAYYALLELAQTTGHDLGSLRQLLIAAAPVSPDKFRRGVEVFGPVVCQCYGQAEVPMLVSMLAPETVAAAANGEHPERLASCGRVTSCTEVAILDDQGRRLAPGERGEICCRGPLVTPGYYAQPEATEEARRFGWHHTGDVGYLDEHEYLYIVDRKKDMIITGGFNVFAAEVEAPLLGVPEVLECAVIGVPDDKWGEAIKAIVVLRDGCAMTPEELVERVRGKLGAIKTPKSIELWPALPKTAVGKTDKRAIRARYWDARERGVN